MGTQAATASIRLTKTAGVVIGDDLGSGTDSFPLGALTWFTYGGETNLWGTTWTAAEINASGFGASVSAYNVTGGGSAEIDAIRITVYWHIGPAEVPTRHLYKVYNSEGTYVGLLPTPISEFGYAQEINTSGVQISIDVPGTADTSRQAPNTLTDESGTTLTDESSVTLTDEGATPIVAPGDATNNALIKNGNLLQIWEYNYYWPNGKCMFRGQMERWDAGFGEDDGDVITITAYSEGQDLDDYLIRGNPYTYTGDVTQSSQNASVTVDQAGMGSAFDRSGQVWKVGSGVTNLGAISLLLLGTADVTIDVYDSPTLGTLLGSVTLGVSVASATEIQFGFPTTITTVPLSTYFFQVRVASGQSILMYYSTANPYANGDMYSANFGGGSGGGAYGVVAGGDLYFKTFSGTGATIGTFTSLDPVTGMLPIFMDDYIARGGLVTYTDDTIEDTGLSLTYSFNTNTINEGVGAVRSMALSGFYSYVDIGTSLLYMKRVSETADITLTRGRHISRFRLGTTIEGVKNSINFTGGETAGVNLYRQYNDATSVRRYRTKLDRRTDNRVTVAATANAIGGSYLEEQKDEQYQTKVTILARTMDITLVKPGMTVAIRGYGTFVDTIVAQIVAIDYTADRVVCMLGVLPKRLGLEVDRTTRGLLAQQTIANPTSPS